MNDGFEVDIGKANPQAIREVRLSMQNEFSFHSDLTIKNMVVKTAPKSGHTTLWITLSDSCNQLSLALMKKLYDLQ